MPTRATVAFSFHSPAYRLFLCTGRAGRQREEIGLGFALEGFEGDFARARANPASRPSSGIALLALGWPRAL